MGCRAIPYNGKEPYIFLSYCHKDAEFVYPLLEQMVRDGYRVWYDDGNEVGKDWPDMIAKYLDASTVCLAVISPNSAGSHNCKNEMNFAISCSKPLVPIMKEEFKMPLGMKLQLSSVHFINAQDYSSNTAILKKVYESEYIARCLEGQGKLPMREAMDPPKETVPENPNRDQIESFVAEERRNDTYKKQPDTVPEKEKPELAVPESFSVEEQPQENKETGAAIQPTADYAAIIAKAEADAAEARKLADQIIANARAEAERAIREAADALAKAEQEAQRKAQEEEDRRKAVEEARRKAEEEERRRKAEEEERRRKAEAEARRVAELEAKRKAEEEAKRKAEEQAIRDAEIRAAQVKAEAEAMLERAKEEAARAIAAAEALIVKQREEAERRAKEEVERRAREEAERRAREEAERRAREDAERRAKEEAERRAKEEAERRAREEAERRAREDAERRAREDAERRAREEAERRAREEAERRAKEEAERRAKEDAERRAKEQQQEDNPDERTIMVGAYGNIDEDKTIIGSALVNAMLIRLNTGEWFRVNTAYTLIGRKESSCEWVLRDNNYIGNSHASLIYHSGQYYLRDEKSTNGTFVNGEQLAPGQQYAIGNLTVFHLHKEPILFVEGDLLSKILEDGVIHLLRSVKTDGVQVVLDEVLHLDRSHVWEDGTFHGDYKVHRKLHAEVVCENGQMLLRDPGSINGTQLNGRDIPHDEYIKLNHLDKIRLGDTVIEARIIKL